MIRIYRDEDEESYSDSDLDESDKILLNKVRSKRNVSSDSEEEVLGVDVSEDESSIIADSDVEGQNEEDDLPDARAWGKNKRNFYSTDYVDPDYGGYQGKDAFLADLEEEEAKNLQKQLVQELDDDDFTLDFAIVTEEKKQEEVVKTDVSQLSKRQKLQLLQKESPELFGLVEDYKAKINICEDFLKPILDMERNGELYSSDATEFVYVYYHLILNYTNNILMYLLLKASRVNVTNHPVIKRLYQYRKLLFQMDKSFEENLKQQIEEIFKGNYKKLTNSDAAKPNKKTLMILKKAEEQEKNEADKKKKRVKFVEGIEETQSEEENEKVEIEEENVVSEEKDEENLSKIDEKRAITYQIAKNKGLTPHRKKEQRNPRVKHRNKFRKAKIRRKGAVREVRKEISRYGGEISGIKASVTKSIKLKS